MSRLRVDAIGEELRERLGVPLDDAGVVRALRALGYDVQGPASSLEHRKALTAVLAIREQWNLPLEALETAPDPVGRLQRRAWGLSFAAGDPDIAPPRVPPQKCPECRRRLSLRCLVNLADVSETLAPHTLALLQCLTCAPESSLQGSAYLLVSAPSRAKSASLDGRSLVATEYADVPSDEIFGRMPGMAGQAELLKQLRRERPMGFSVKVGGWPPFDAAFAKPAEAVTGVACAGCRHRLTVISWEVGLCVAARGVVLWSRICTEQGCRQQPLGDLEAAPMFHF